MVLVSSKGVGIGDNSNEIGNDDSNDETTIIRNIVQEIVALLWSTIDVNTATSFDLKELLKAHFDMALTQFSKDFESADLDHCGMYKGLLIAQLKTAFRKFCLDFQNKRTANLSILVHRFRSQIEAQVKSECKPPETLQKILNDVKDDILPEIDSNLFPDLAVQLNNLLDEEASCFISENNMRLLEPHNTFNSILPDLLTKYSKMVDLILPDEELTTVSDQKLVSTFAKCQVEGFSNLNEIMTFDNQDMKEMYESRLTTIFENLYSEKVATVKLKKEKKLVKAASIVSIAVETFSKSISAEIEENRDDSVFNKFCDDEMKALVSSITEQIYDVLQPDPTVAKEMLATAKLKMQTVVQEMKNQRKIQEQNFKDQWNTHINAIVDVFVIRFDEHLKSKMLPDRRELEVNRVSLINELIQDADFSWMVGCRQEKDFRNEFHNDVKQRMLNCSLPIMEKHSEILDDIFDHQKIQMNYCLENLKIKLAELPKGDSDLDKIVDRAKTFGNNATDEFQMKAGNTAQTCVAVTTKLLSDLREAINKMEEEFLKQVRDRKLLINAEISQIVNATIDNYRCLMNAFLVASNYGKDKITQIHGHLSDQAWNSLQWKLRSGKYCVNQSEMQHDLNTNIEIIYSNTMSAIDDQHHEWNKKLESCHQKWNNHYIQQFTSLMGSVKKEEELEEIHSDLKAQTIHLWEQSYPMDSCAEKLLSERQKCYNNLENIFSTTIRKKWQQINHDIDRDAKKMVEEIVKEYEQSMKSTLKLFDYVSADMIKSKHEIFSKNAHKSLTGVTKPKNVNEKIYVELLTSRIDSTLECFFTENSQKKNDIEMNISNKIRQLKEVLMRDIIQLTVLPDISTSIQMHSNFMQQIVNEYETNIQDELKKFAFSKLDDALKEVRDEWDNKQPDPNQLQLSIYEAVEKYNKEMGNRLSKSGEIFVPSAIKAFHEQATATVLKDFQLNLRQTSATREKFDNTIDDLFKKHQELNNIRASERFGAAIGIDLGTTFSCVAIYTGGKIKMIPDREHHSNTVPSYVFYETATKTVVGHSAKDLSVIHPRDTIFDSKRLIGRKFNDSKTQKDIAQWPFKVIRDPERQNQPNIEVHGQSFHPEEISGEILKHLKQNAEVDLGRDVKDVVITVPAYFNDAQKRATKSAAAFADINVLEIINEPTAAAIAYSLNYTDGKSRNILVFDLGGGTFDVSVASTKKGELVVKAVGGNNHLGGEDFDSNMVDFCIEKFRQQTGLVIPKNVSNSTTIIANASVDVVDKTFERLRRLRQKCEQAKINLSKTDKVRVVIDYIFEHKNLDVEIMAQDFNDMNRHLFNECIKIVQQTVNESGLSKEQIDDIILVGGSSRIPEVQRVLTEFFDGKSLIMAINPDEVVAQGAAYRAAILSGFKELQGITFKDVNPLSLGTSVIGEKFSIIIPKNTLLPTERTQTYLTTKDYQTAMTIDIYEGEDEKVENNNLLGEFVLGGIPSKRKGEEPVDITINCDNEGLLHVTAVVRSNKSSNNITIHSNKRGILTEEDIQAAKTRHTS